MAFGKKKDAAPAGDPEESPEIEAAVDEAAPAHLDALLPADDAEPASTGEPVVAAAPPAAQAPGTDALLSMFQETKSDVNDLAVLTDLAGETDIDDILEELRTLRAALGITDAFDDDLAAAA
jgi:predicted DsbA family dithiol-disulfide isomerase